VPVDGQERRPSRSRVVLDGEPADEPLGRMGARGSSFREGMAQIGASEVCAGEDGAAGEWGRGWGGGGWWNNRGRE
jgi:hypothetical protein